MSRGDDSPTSPSSAAGRPWGPGGDPFDVLGLPPRYSLTGAEVERAYLGRAGDVHPDRASGDADAAAALNRARTALKDPMARAEALLARLGGGARAADAPLPPGFLMEIFDVRERIDEAMTSGDHAERARWEDWAEQRRGEHIRAIGASFERADLDGVRRELNVWRYTERILERLSGAPGGPGL